MRVETYYYLGSKVSIRGTTYNAGEVVMLPSDIEPAFSIIRYLIKASNETWLLVLEVLETVKYDVHYHAFRVKHSCSPSLVMCKQAALVDPHPLVLNFSFNLQSHFFVCVKYYV